MGEIKVTARLENEVDLQLREAGRLGRKKARAIEIQAAALAA